MKRKGALLSAVLGAGGLVIAGFALKDELLIERFIWKLESEQADSRLRAAKRLGELRSTRAIPAIVAAMAREEAELSWECASALARICAREARGGRERRRPNGLDELTTDQAVAAAVERAVRKLGVRDAKVRTQATEQLVYLGDHALTPLVARLRSSDATVREYCVEILKLRGASAVNALCRTARDDAETEIRIAAIHALGWIRERQAVPTLLQSVGDPDPKIVMEVVWSLGSLRDERAIAALREIFTNASHKVELRVRAARALFRVDTVSARTAIHAVVAEEEDKTLRRRFGSILESDPLVTWPSDLLELRQLAIDATTLQGETFGPEKVEQLLTHVRSPYPEVSSYCLFALAALNQEEAVRRLAELEPRPASLYGVFAEEASPPALEFLLEALCSDDGTVRRRAVYGVGVAAGRWGAPLLVSQLDGFAGRALVDLLQRAGVDVVGEDTAGELEPHVVKEWWQKHGSAFLRNRSVPALHAVRAQPATGVQNVPLQNYTGPGNGFKLPPPQRSSS